MIRVENVHKTFVLHQQHGVRLPVLADASLTVNAGECVVLHGHSGSGKSTLLRSISGMNPIAGGEILFCGEKITGLPSSLIARKGLCMVPEGRQLFPELSARDNLLIGAYPYRKDKARVQKNLDFAYQMFPAIRKYEDRMANTFSGGEQQMISIARGLMSEPKLMMIDEMSLGLAPMIIADLFKVIKRLNAQGISILLVEQNARQALRIADRAYVMENGRMVMEGSGKELLENEHVKVAYLGM